MSQLLRARPDNLAALRERAQQCCLAFSGEPLPPGSSSPTGRVGIEVDPATGRSLLHIEHGLTYSGPSRDVARWYQGGTQAFDSYSELEEWLAGPLAAAFAGQAVSTDYSDASPSSVASGSPTPILLDTKTLTARLMDAVVGQERSIHQIVAGTALHLARRAPRRPYTALALGPTGVGKTLLAETLAEAIAEITGEPCEFLRLDMTEFQERHTVSKLFGSPPGYLGYGEETGLVAVLRSGNRVIVLIDEVEKAHPDVFIAIMNLMDAGRLTPATGPSIDARPAILLFTTNLAADVLTEALAADPDVAVDLVACDSLVRATLREHGIAPELVGRLHSLLVFEALSDAHLDEVLRRSIRREGATFGFEVTTVSTDVLARLRRHQPDPGSGVRAWEHLIGVELGPALLDACRNGIDVQVAVLDGPLRIDRAEERS